MTVGAQPLLPPSATSTNPERALASSESGIAKKVESVISKNAKPLTAGASAISCVTFAVLASKNIIVPVISIPIAVVSGIASLILCCCMNSKKPLDNVNDAQLAAAAGRRLDRLENG